MSQHQLVIGLGESGMALVRHAARTGVPVTVYDSRQAPAQLSVLQSKYPQVAVHCGAFKDEYLDGITQVLLSPGLSPHVDPLKSILASAAQRNVEVVGELAVFMQALGELNDKSGYAPKVLAVTGTNGKTTVTCVCRWV